MGMQSSTDFYLAQVRTVGAFTVTGAGVSALLFRSFNVSIWGTFVGTVALERSFDGCTTWLNCTKTDGTANSFTAAASGAVKSRSPACSTA